LVPETPDDGDMEIDGAANTISVGAITCQNYDDDKNTLNISVRYFLFSSTSFANGKPICGFLSHFD